MILKDFKDSIGIFENALTKKQCEDMILLHNTATDRVYEGNTSGGVQKQYKDTTDLELTIDEGAIVTALVKTLITSLGCL